jgi:hypothetical protein
MINQKEKEKKDIELFLDLSKVKYNSYTLDCEKPDCDLQTDKGIIGIEVTEFVRSKEYCSKVRSINDTLTRIKEETKSAIKKITDINLTINFSQQTAPPRKINSTDRKRIVEFLVSHILKVEVQEKMNEGLFHIEFEYTMKENEFIESVRISTYPGKKTLDITENTFWMSGVIPKKDIEEIIYAKEAKMDFDRNDNTWLLLVVAETNYSCGIIDPYVLEYKFHNYRFDKVFMLERFSKKLYELTLLS